MNATDEASWPPPEWMRLVGPGRLDVGILGQSVFWVNREAVVLRLDAMSEAHLLAVAEMLRGRAMQMHFWAIVDAIGDIRESARTGVPCGHLLEYAVTGSSLADVDPDVWLASTPLMRAIGRRLAGG
jgi:hypothetical protein